MTNKLIARRLQLAADLIELTGGNAFRARAYAGAARRIDRLEEAALQLAAQGTLQEVAGVGAGIARDVEQILEGGSFESLDELIAATPPGLLEVLRVQGLGPKRARALWQGLGVTDLETLEEMAATGRVAELAGFGKKTQATILESVARLRRYSRRRRYADALAALEPLLQALAKHEAAERVAPAGEIRRRLETVGEAHLVVAGEEGALRSVLAHHATPSDEQAEGGAYLGTLPDGLGLRVEFVPAEHFGAALWRATGSEAHLAAFTERFGEPGAAAESEEAIYEGAGLAYIPPELREGLGEIEAAAEDALPALITTGDLKGSLHNHSTYSDGAHTIREMAEAARAMGYEYFGLCDHSRSLTIAGGLSIERLREQAEEVRALNRAFEADGGPPFRIFHGSECDILRDGELDYPDDVLAELDFVVASIHSHFELDEAAQTERLLRAARHPSVRILGHLTGRILLGREGYAVDHTRIIEACAEHGVAIELNANPYRLDMDWRYLREATGRGVLIAINPDAHSTEELAYVEWGVAVARKGWLTAKQCLNAMPLEAFSEWLARAA